MDSEGAAHTLLDVNRDPRLWEEIVRRTERHTVSRIFIGDRHVGGCDDLFELERRGELARLLRDCNRTRAVAPSIRRRAAFPGDTLVGRWRPVFTP
ncbi:MAG: hypothetical protein P9E24_09990 [Candidatus Competibacter sp.]|nr:hypothetical protein [Candidatus Competibacter sp.]MDG4585297.1 hypothetical protein [Candidatus Competibacter sp.]